VIYHYKNQSIMHVELVLIALRSFKAVDVTNLTPLRATVTTPLTAIFRERDKLTAPVISPAPPSKLPLYPPL
jgi:hypothetical protein